MSNINYTKPNKLEDFSAWCSKKYPLWCKSNFPFIEDTFEALDTYGLICKIVQYLNEIKQNLNTTEENVQNIYDFVTNYFDNLDVQNEINNKLDEMASSGVLQEIISSYLQTKAIFAYDNVEYMKKAENLIAGSFAKTLGYYSINDGGNATYKIRNRTFNDIVDESFIILLNNENLVAELLIETPVNAGCIGFLPSNPNVNLLNNLLQKCFNVILTKGRYIIENNIRIPTYAKLDLNDSIIEGTIEFNGSLQSKLMNGYVYGNPSIYFNQNRVGDTVIENMELISTGKALVINSDTGNNIFKHVKFKGIKGNPSVHLQNSYEFPINYLHFEDCSFDGEIGILVDRATNYLWINGCDFTSKIGIKQNVNCENFFITKNAFFHTIVDSVGYLIENGNVRMWNLNLTGNLFSNTANIECKAVDIRGNLNFSKLDNMFYNYRKGYYVTNHSSTFFGKTQSAITGKVDNEIIKNVSSSTYPVSISETYGVAGTYTLSLPIEQIPYTPDITISSDKPITDVVKVFENNKAKVTFTLSEATTVTVLAT